MKNRPQRLISFLVVWLTMFSCISLNGQNSWKKVGMTVDFEHLWLPGSNAAFAAGPEKARVLPGHLDQSGGLVWETRIQADRLYLIPSDLYYSQSGYFCKREWALEKVTHIPFRFRLGSLADCNTLEGKR